MKYHIALLCIFCACQESNAKSEVKYIKYYISQYEPVHIKIPSEFQGDIVGTLIEIASDPTEKRFYRERAIEALKDYPEERVSDFLLGWQYGEEPFLSARASSSLESVTYKIQEKEEQP